MFTVRAACRTPSRARPGRPLRSPKTGLSVGGERSADQPCVLSQWEDFLPTAQLCQLKSRPASREIEDEIIEIWGGAIGPLQTTGSTRRGHTTASTHSTRALVRGEQRAKQKRVIGLALLQYLFTRSSISTRLAFAPFSASSHIRGPAPAPPSACDRRGGRLELRDSHSDLTGAESLLRNPTSRCSIALTCGHAGFDDDDSLPTAPPPRRRFALFDPGCCVVGKGARRQER
jgi:hypothetical protein